MPDPDLASRLAAVRHGIEDAARAANRSPLELTTIVVTKFHDAGLIRRLYALGVRNFGESRHQEAQAKIASLSDLEARWHFVGQLQSKKARHVIAYSDVIHSVDRTSLLEALEVTGVPVDCFIQVNLTEDPQRGGVAPSNLVPLAERLTGSSTLRLLGVMAVAPLGEDPRRAFARLRHESLRVAGVNPTATAISAGMSADYPAAIAEGATHLRIGTAITGNRPAQR